MENLKNTDIIKPNTKKLGFGLMRLPLIDENDYKSVDIEYCKKMVDTFIKNGFTYFDTAYIYHGGAGEKITKEILCDRYPRDSFTLATKLPCGMLKSEDDNQRIFNEQLKNTGVQYFDYYLLHSLGGDAYHNAEKYHSFDFCYEMKKQGKIKHLGFSIHDTPEVLEEILINHPYIEFVQLQINYLDWENQSIQAHRMYDVCTKYKKPVIVMEPIKGGTLSHLEENAESLIYDYDKNATPSSLAIRFCASLDNVIMVLSGMSTLSQINENIGFMSDFKPLNSTEYHIIDKITNIIRSSNSIPCTSCNYCTTVCPKNIKIPFLFAVYNNDLQSINRQFSVQYTLYNHFSSTNPTAKDCIGCKACERICPQHLPISSLLKQVKAHFDNYEK